MWPVFRLTGSPEEGARLFFKSFSKSPKKYFHWLGLRALPWLSYCGQGWSVSPDHICVLSPLLESESRLRSALPSRTEI